MPEAKVSPGAASTRLRLTEIFCSIQGESSRVGLPTVFVRLTGCPLRCRWCDTEYAFNGGKYWSIEETLAGADAIVLLTEWNQYRGLDLQAARAAMRGNVFVDLRNVYERETVASQGFHYVCVGR